jgi:predicted HTH transcriptional regulator
MYSQDYDSVMLSEMDYLDVKNLAQTGEGTFLEFKQTTPNPAKIAREMAAFANTKGGMLLIGVDDDRNLIGVDSYQEEGFLLKKAADEWCNPVLDIHIELVQFGKRDLMVIKIPEASQKPVFVKEDGGPIAFIRDHDQSLSASIERIQILENEQSNKEVTFQYGPDEQKLFRYLNEYSEINVRKLSHLIGVGEHKAGDILVDLVGAGILTLFTKDNIDYFAFSSKCKS